MTATVLHDARFDVVFSEIRRCSGVAGVYCGQNVSAWGVRSRVSAKASLVVGPDYLVGLNRRLWMDAGSENSWGSLKKGRP